MKTRNWMVSLLGLGLWLPCWSCGGTAPSGPTYSLPDSTLPITGPAVAGSEGLDRNMTALLRRWNVPGAVVAVATKGNLVFTKGYGYSNLEGRTPMQPDSLFRIGSTTKILTAVAVLQLVEQNRLNLDANFLDVLTDYAVPTGGDSRLHSITIRMLLQHSGGWDRNISGDPFARQIEIARELGVPSPATCPDMIRYMLAKPLDFNPGTGFAYSNLGYCILGRVVERVSGETYDTFVKTHILEPAAVQDMYIGTTRQGRQGAREVRYYDYPGAPLAHSVFAGEGMVPLQYGGLELQDSNGGWIGSSIDLLRVMAALDGSRTAPPLGQAMLAEMIANPGLPGLGNSTWYGFGLFVGPGPDKWYHGGSFPGAQGQLYRDSNVYTYAVISNSRTQYPEAFAPDMEAAVTGALAAGFLGSATDLFPLFPSLAPPFPPGAPSR